MLKREWGAESNGKIPHLFILSKTAALVPEFAVEDSAFGQNCSLGACVYSEKPVLGQNTLMIIIHHIIVLLISSIFISLYSIMICK